MQPSQYEYAHKNHIL